MKTHYALYTDLDPFCCLWLENLIRAGQLPRGDVHCGRIEDIQPSQLAGYTQCHFFAGVGGWAFAAKLANWPESRPVWTGSCPCTPFSNSGRRDGFEDARHLWPIWFNLIRECKPPTIFGENVDSATSWLDLVLSDLESCPYACATADLPAASVGLNQIRQRLWFVADSNVSRWANSQRVTSAQAQAHFRPTASLVHCSSPWNIRGPVEPDQNWVVNGLPGVGQSVSAFGNSIVPQLGAVFIRSFLEAEQELIRAGL